MDFANNANEFLKYFIENNFNMTLFALEWYY